MKVLLLGATGNLGLRLVPALLTHDHQVTVFVRSTRKLKSLLPASTYEMLNVVEGDAKDSSAIKKAILESNVDAVVNSAGVAAMAPWASSDLPEIFRAVLAAVMDASSERGQSLRVWFLGGLGILNYPGTESMVSNYLPVYLEHRGNIKLLRDLPLGTVDWSMLAPYIMHPESTDFSLPVKSSRSKLTARASTLPMWQDSLMKYVPLIGRTLSLIANASRYETTLEQNADLIASDLESLESSWTGKAVGIIDESQ